MVFDLLFIKIFIMSTRDQIEFIKRATYNEEFKTKLITILEKLLKQEESMTRKEILAYAKKIKPVMRGSKKYVALSPENEGNTLFWIPAYPIHHQSFSYVCHHPLKKAEGLKEIARLTTYHTYGGYHGFLRPSADEAIIQCPKEILNKVCAFEFQTDTLDFRKIYNAGLDRHILTTVYYEGSLPEDIAAQEVSW